MRGRLRQLGEFSRLRIPAGVADLHAWLPAAVPSLAELEAGWEDVTKGTCLLHGDLRADNMLITNTGEVVAVDCPEACVGAPWVDLVLALPSFPLLGADPEDIVRRHPLTRQLHSKVIDTLLSAVAGYFTSRCLQPPPPGLPTVRDFQRQQAIAALQWLRRETTQSATLCPDRDRLWDGMSPVRKGASCGTTGRVSGSSPSSSLASPSAVPRSQQLVERL